MTNNTTTNLTSNVLTYFCGSCGQQMSYMFEGEIWSCMNPNCPSLQNKTFFPRRKCLKHNYEWDVFGQCMYCQGEHFWNKEDSPNAKQCEKHGMFYLGECGMCMTEAKDTTKETKEQVMSVMNNNNNNNNNSQRKYLPTIAELIDRLSICQLKEIYIKEHREEYTKEISDILHDIQLILLNETPQISANTIHGIVNVALYNLLIWINETNYRKGIKDGNNLELTHSLNGIRNNSKNIIQECMNGRKDYKIDCLAADHSQWEPSWGKLKNDKEKETK